MSSRFANGNLLAPIESTLMFVAPNPEKGGSMAEAEQTFALRSAAGGRDRNAPILRRSPEQRASIWTLAAAPYHARHAEISPLR